MALCISGTADVPGCGHRLHPRGVGMPGPWSAGIVQGRDVTELASLGEDNCLPESLIWVLVPSFLKCLLKSSLSHNNFRSLLSRGKWEFMSLEKRLYDSI